MTYVYHTCDPSEIPQVNHSTKYSQHREVDSLVISFEVPELLDDLSLGGRKGIQNVPDSNILSLMGTAKATDAEFCTYLRLESRSPWFKTQEQETGTPLQKLVNTNVQTRYQLQCPLV